MKLGSVPFPVVMEYTNNRQNTRWRTLGKAFVLDWKNDYCCFL